MVAPSALAGREEEALIFCEALMGWLLSVTDAKDRVVRMRSCQLLSQIVNALPEEADLEEVRPRPNALQPGAMFHTSA